MEDQKQILSFLDAAARGDIAEVERLVAAGGEAVVHGCDEDGQVPSSDLPLETILYYVYPAVPPPCEDTRSCAPVCIWCTAIMPLATRTTH